MHTTVIAARLGPNIAAFTCQIDGRVVAVVNTLASTDAQLRTQITWALLATGMDAGHAIGALHGVRS
ncbi:hypothetical protein [Streptomyces sp. NBC_01506]|uniref:hypothetical protein n=1 Tax=Streptomyces sp. NBC_01506 TaxID=2903887 RepID=UPI00386BEE5A